MALLAVARMKLCLPPEPGVSLRLVKFSFYLKAEHRRALRPMLNGRTDGSMEFKHQKISAVRRGLGEAWIPSYKLTFNFQM